MIGVTLLSLAVAGAFAQNAPRRPLTALVLSGGGARGAAHVGVLEVLEQLHVPVDFVVGTSMGSAVGGLYASGLSPDQLEVFFRDFKWQEAFSDRPSRDGLSFRRKQDDFQYLIGRGIGMRGTKFRFPLGFTQGQVFIGEMRTLGGMTQNLPSFDDLPTPFRCVATDLIAAEPVVISSGDLALAIRASVAVAPLFSPIWYQGRLLVDGGYLNNIPVDVARAMGADRVIVVDIGTPLQPKAKINSIIDVFNQTSRLGGAEFDRRQIRSLTKKDLFLQPDLHDMSFTDFARIPQAIEWGRQAALAAKDQLARFSVSPDEYRAYLKARKPRAPPPGVIDRVEIQTDARLSPRVIRRMIRQEEGQPFDPRELQEDLLRVQGIGYFDYVDYNIVREGGQNVLVVHAPKLYWGPGNWRFGLELDEDFRTKSLYTLSAQYTHFDTNKWGGEPRIQTDVGTNSDVKAEFFQPIAYEPRLFHIWAPIFLDPRAGYFSQLVDINTPNTGGTERYRRLFPIAALDAGYFVSNIAELRAGVERSWNSANLQFGQVGPGQSNVYWNDADVFGRVTVDTLDKVQFPRRGAYFQSEWANSSTELGSGRPNSSIDSSGAAFASYGKHTLGVKAIYSTNLDTHTPAPRFFTLGGLLRLSGFPEDQLIGTERALGQIRYYWNPFSFGSMPVYLGSALEWGGAWLGRSQVSYRSGYWAGTGFLGLRTPLGPFYLGSSFATGGRFSETLYLGHTF